MAVDNKVLCDHLISLAQLDIDAVHAYSQAIDRIDVQDIKDQLSRFRQDHERHVRDLSPVINRLGGMAPEFKPDFKGFLIQGMTTLRSVTGTEGALKAMKMNEQLTNKTYDTALGWELPADVRSIVEKNRDDERRHLAYITECIERKAWQQPQAA